MRKSNFLFLAFCSIIFTVTLISCDSKSKLAKDLEGTWAMATPRNLMISEGLSGSYLSLYQFFPEVNKDNPTLGNFEMDIMIQMTGEMPESDQIVEPYTYSASGTASINGIWRMTEDDEVVLSFYPSTFQVKIDPKDVILEDNILTGENQAIIDSLKPAFASNLQDKFRFRAADILFNIRKIDDIRIKGNEMKCEILDEDRIFYRQEEPLMEMKN